jgi:hypothetical protein
MRGGGEAPCCRWILTERNSFGYFLATFWLLFGYFLCLVTFWLLFVFGYFSATFWLLFGYFLATFWLLFGYFLTTFWLLFGYFLATFWLLFGYFFSNLVNFVQSFGHTGVFIPVSGRGGC